MNIVHKHNPMPDSSKCINEMYFLVVCLVFCNASLFCNIPNTIIFMNNCTHTHIRKMQFQNRILLEMTKLMSFDSIFYPKIWLQFCLLIICWVNRFFSSFGLNFLLRSYGSQEPCRIHEFVNCPWNYFDAMMKRERKNYHILWSKQYWSNTNAYDLTFTFNQSVGNCINAVKTLK